LRRREARPRAPSPAITLLTYAHEFARVEHADRARDALEAAFGKLLK
jgi:hypothetical protein